jgi:hypothetical protein
MASKDPYTLDNLSAIPAPFDKIIPDYFRTWDNPHANVEDVIKSHAPTCYVNFGGHHVVGHDGIRAMRAGFIDPVKGPCIDLEHNLKTCWVLAGESSAEEQSFIIKSSIWYLLVNGQKVDADCTSYIKFVAKGDGAWHITEYEVFMSSFEVMDAIEAIKQQQ